MASIHNSPPLFYFLRRQSNAEYKLHRLSMYEVTRGEELYVTAYKLDIAPYNLDNPSEGRVIRQTVGRLRS